MSRPGNPSAFPGIEGEAGYGGAFRDHHGNFINTQSGMTLRDYFAAKAMQTMITNFLMDQDAGAEVAETAYKYADAMLVEREKE